jgi:hypothetical protein
MRKVLIAAGIYHIVFAVTAICWPHWWFDCIAAEQPNHPMMWQGVGLVTGLFGVSLLAAAKDPVEHWAVLLVGLLKFTVGVIGFGLAIFYREIPLRCFWLMCLDNLIWFPPFIKMLWISLRAHTGVPPSRSVPYSVEEATQTYLLSDGQTLAEASSEKPLAMVFLRHFGCTFTRQILRGLEQIQLEAATHGADLVLVHMLQKGKETKYLSERSGVSRIADPRCELYRAFGLGKGGFLELFGPHVWWRAAIAIFSGCGLGHLAGDGLQMPGAFLLRDGKIISSQRAHSASDLPHLPELFRALGEQERDPQPISQGS